MNTLIRFAARLLCSFPLLAAGTFAQAEPGETLAPGYGELPYTAPVAGSYTLPAMGPAADGKVLESDGTAATLHGLYGGKITVLSFIYATCDDVNGCPLATTVLHKLKARLAARPAIAAKLRLLTLSFNPSHDTPAAMAEYGKHFQGGGIDWRFLTTAGEADIQPILQAYGQSADREVDEQGRETGKFSHLLKVFLIDAERRIRNVYTVSVLHPDLVLADIETLLREDPAQPAAAAPVAAPADLARAGDDKRAYETADYRTRSMALTNRRGKPADLLAIARRPPLGLPAVPVPRDNPLTREKIALGRKLFYDRRLSLNGTMSCAMCHVAEQGFTSQEQNTAIGIEGRTVRRNAPTLYNVAYLDRLFHDGRESSLENQVWGPFLAPNEMGNPSVGAVVDKLKGLDDYRDLFERAYRRGPTMETVSQALASYERTLVSAHSPFDRWYYGHDDQATDAAARRGWRCSRARRAASNVIGSASAPPCSPTMPCTTPASATRQPWRKRPPGHGCSSRRAWPWTWTPPPSARSASPNPATWAITRSPRIRPTAGNTRRPACATSPSRRPTCTMARWRICAR